MGYVKAFLGPFLKDRAVWLALASWALSLANAKLDLGMGPDEVNGAAGALSVFAVARVSYIWNKKRKVVKAEKTEEKSKE